jgi:signal peptidase I
VSEQTPKRRSEKAGFLNFSREMISALGMAFIAIVYVIQAFRIPTGSMEKSLLVGDFLLGLKFIYGAPVLPFTYMKFPGVTKPKPGDVIIFKYPGNDRKDYIKRCVAGPGQVVRISGKTLTVDGKDLVLPPNGQFERDGRLDSIIAEFPSLRIPARGDTLLADTMQMREFLFFKHLVRQENPRKNVTVRLQLYLNGEYANSRPVLSSYYGGRAISFDQIDFNRIDIWPMLASLEDNVRQVVSDSVKVEIRREVLIDGKPVGRYPVKNDNYFMMGDNRDNSLDSRFWGYLNGNFVKAKAFILYFSLDKETPWLLLPLKIRWNRIGKLIRSWDGLAQ